MKDEKYLKLTDTELERMLAVAHQAGMEIGKERDWQKEGPTYPNFSTHVARALVKHERQHFEEVMCQQRIRAEEVAQRQEEYDYDEVINSNQ